MELRRLQNLFQAGILSPEPTDAEPILAEIHDTTKEVKATLYGAYQFAYSARLIEVLQANFDKTWTLLGDAGFEEAAHAYVASHPSPFRNARWYGDGFPDFLRARFETVPAVADVAAVEWALAAAFDGEDAPVVALEAMAAIHPNDWPALQFALHPTVALVPVTTQAADIYLALVEGQPPGDLGETPPQTVLVWREGLTARFRALDAEEAVALAMVKDGANFAAICEAMAASIGEVDAVGKAAGLLRLWLETGLITRLETS